MKYNDFYEIAIIVNDEIADINPVNISFSLHDSINSLYSWVTCTLQDTSGIIQDSFFTTEGLVVKIEFGTDDQINSCSYVIRDDELPTPKTRGLLNGDVEINLVHEWYDKQEIKSTAYKKRISEIVEQLAGGYSFDSIDKNDTGNQDIWYQPLMTDARFINNILLPNAYSYNADKSPFYAYITCDNVFHFRRLNSMFTAKSLTTISYSIAEESTKEYDPSTIAQITRWREGSTIHKDLRHRKIFKIDREDGKLIEEEDFIYSYPELEKEKNIPIIGDKELITSYLNIQYLESEVGRKENLLGQTYSTTKKGMFLEKFMLLLPLNLKLISGNPIDLKIFTINAEGDNVRLTKTFSGKYIIVESQHTWNGFESKGYSKLIIGRKLIDLPDSYFIKAKFLA